jgi:hypothetical protein
MPPSIISLDLILQRQVSDCSLMMDGICGFAKKHETVDKQEDNDDKTNSNDTQVRCMTSPFIAYDDGYTFPNLYQETNDMLYKACVLVHPMAELRRLACEGMLALHVFCHHRRPLLKSCKL